MIPATRMATTTSCWRNIRVTCVHITIMLGRSNGSVAVFHKNFLSARCWNVSNVHIEIYIILQYIVCSIMLMVTSTLSPQCNVVGKRFVAAPFICVVAPPTIVVRLDVMTQVVGYRGRWLMPQCVNTSHVTQVAQSNVVYVIERRRDIRYRGRSKTPCPASAYTCILEI